MTPTSPWTVLIEDENLTVTCYTWLPDGWDYLEQAVYYSFKAQHKLLDRMWYETALELL